MDKGKFQYIYDGKPDKQVVETFETNLLDRLLESTKDFYSRYVHANVNQPVIDFQDGANRYLDEERERSNKYYNIQEFRELVWRAQTKELIEKPGNDLISRTDGLNSMLKKNDKKYAKIFFDYVTEIKFDMSKFIAEIIEYIKSKIKTITESEIKDTGSESHHQIKELIDCRTHMLEICRDCFNSNNEIKSSICLQLQKLFAQIDDFPKYLADFIDQFITKYGKERTSDTGFEEIEEIFEIINLTAQRDALLHFYEITLKNRLLGKETFFEDIEKHFLSKLSQLFGETQIMKVKGMINDVITSKDTMSNFKSFCQNKKERKKILENREVEIKLLTKATWPAEVLEFKVVKIPDELNRIGSQFSEFYTGTMQGRKVEWLLNEGGVEIEARFNDDKPKRIMCSVAQMAILYCLDRSIGKSLKFKDLIHEGVNLKKSYVSREIRPLCKTKIVLREKEWNAPIDENEKYTLNMDFKSKNRVLNLVMKKTLKGRDKNTDQKEILENRKIVIEAVSVRIMKSKKMSDFQELLTEVRKVVEHFPPSDRQMRSILDDLIRREFLERDAKNFNMYIYKA